MRRWAYKARNIHTFLKTAYVHFRLPSLVERAHIPRESISARLPAFPLHPCLLPSPSSTISRSPAPSFLRYIDLLPPPLTHTFSWVLHLLQYRAQCTTPCTEWSGVQRREAEWSGAAVRLWWMWFWEGESGIRPPAFLLWYLYTPFYHPLTLPILPLAPRTPLPSLLYQLPPRQPTNLSFVSLPRQLRLSQVDTQLQNIQFERKVKTKWIFQREYSRYQKSMLSLLRWLHTDSRYQKKCR